MSTNSLKGGESIKIHFVMKKKVSFGQALYVVGNIPEIGCWRVRNSLRLTWNSVRNTLISGRLLVRKPQDTRRGLENDLVQVRYCLLGQS